MQTWRREVRDDYHAMRASSGSAAPIRCGPGVAEVTERRLVTPRSNSSFDESGLWQGDELGMPRSDVLFESDAAGAADAESGVQE